MARFATCHLGVTGEMTLGSLRVLSARFVLLPSLDLSASDLQRRRLRVSSAASTVAALAATWRSIRDCDGDLREPSPPEHGRPASAVCACGMHDLGLEEWADTASRARVESSRRADRSSLMVWFVHMSFHLTVSQVTVTEPPVVSDSVGAQRAKSPSGFKSTMHRLAHLQALPVTDPAAMSRCHPPSHHARPKTAIPRPPLPLPYQQQRQKRGESSNRGFQCHFSEPVPSHVIAPVSWQ